MPEQLDYGCGASILGPYFGLWSHSSKILHDPKDPKLWELWYIPYNG